MVSGSENSPRQVLVTEQIRKTANVSESMQPHVLMDQNYSEQNRKQPLHEFTATCSNDSRGTQDCECLPAARFQNTEKVHRDVHDQDSETAQYVKLMLVPKQDDQCSREAVSIESKVRSASSGVNREIPMMRTIPDSCDPPAKVAGGWIFPLMEEDADGVWRELVEFARSLEQLNCDCDTINTSILSGER